MNDSPRNDRELAEYIEYNIDTQGADVTKGYWGTSFSIKTENGSRILVSCGPIHAAGPTMTSGEPSSIATDASANRPPRKLVFPI